MRRAKYLHAEAKGVDRPRRQRSWDLSIFVLFTVACKVLVLTTFLPCN